MRGLGLARHALTSDVTAAFGRAAVIRALERNERDGAGGGEEQMRLAS